MLRRGGPDTSRLIQHWIWLPLYPFCHACNGEEALTFLYWFNTKFRCPLTLPVMCGGRRLWHFKTYSTLNLDVLSPILPCVEGGGGPDISRLIQDWIWLPLHPSYHACSGEEALTFLDWFKTSRHRSKNHQFFKSFSSLKLAVSSTLSF